MYGHVSEMGLGLELEGQFTMPELHMSKLLKDFV